MSMVNGLFEVVIVVLVPLVCIEGLAELDVPLPLSVGRGSPLVAGI